MSLDGAAGASSFFFAATSSFLPSATFILFLASAFLLFRHRVRQRRQRLQIGGNRRAVFRLELRNVLLHPRHEAADHVEIRRIPGFQQIGDVLRAPIGKPVIARRDIRDLTLAFRIAGAGKGLALDDAAEEVARRMTLAAMTGPVDEIVAAIDLGACLGIWLERLAVDIEELPEADCTADVVGKVS